ncbi:MAG: HAD family hydrolase [Planctomycetota bacterium]
MNAEAQRPAVFLDRDKTLIEDPGYIDHPDLVRLIDGVPDALIRLRNLGYTLVVVSNQSGIARGLLTEDDLAAIHDRLRSLLRDRGADVDAIYYCPYLDGPQAVREEYRRDSAMRKPKPGMLLRAAEEMNLDLERSWMVGDSLTDVEAGRAAGCRAVLVGNRAGEDRSSAECVAENIEQAAEYIHKQTITSAPQAAEAERPTEPEAEDPAMTAGVGFSAEPVLAGDDSSSESAPVSGRTPVESASPSPCARKRAACASASAPSPVRQQDLGAPKRRVTARTGSPRNDGDSTNDEVLSQILDELRMMRRERQYEDFSIGKLAGAITQAFAFCAIGWGLYVWIDAGLGAATPATIWLLAGIAFQLLALTCFASAHKK